MIIGLTGYAGSGKDALANYLVAEHGFRRVAFADKVRALAERLYPNISVAVSHHGWDEAKKRPYVRMALQEIGMAVREVVHPDAWVEAALTDIEGDIVVTDVRFPNEVGRIWELGGTVYRVHRPGVGPVNGHTSETALDIYDLPMISNGGHLGDLARAAASLVTHSLA